jgi:membrane protease YdiL (CAAX protease family)
MAPESPDPLLGAMVLVLATASFGTWFVLLGRLSDGPILPYEPRRPVPWHGIWILLPVLLVALAVFAAIRGGDPAEDTAPATAADLIDQIARGSAQQMAFVVAFLAVVIVASGATRADLGLPKSVHEFARDVRIGIVAWLASLVPVYGVQILLIKLFGPTEGHPLIKMVQEQADPTLFLLAFAAAVLVAPICEELLFRLLLQGWLEKWEAGRFGWRGEMTNDEFPMTNDEARTTDEEPSTTNDEARMTNDDFSVSDQSSFDVGHSSSPTDQPPQIGSANLPQAWLPIAASSLLFALAHVGYGPDPIPLFLLALILGYVYQRTHRIVPSMVAHALFNGMSLFALWRVMSASAP